jgi:PhzF family phenazine biosynthesis protein
MGILDVAITLATDRSITIQFQTPPVDLVMSKITHQDVAQALGVSLDAVDIKNPVMFETNNRDLYVTLKSLAHLEDVHVDQKSAKLFSEKHDIVAFALVTNETVAKDSHLHMRCFAPLVGIPEDPFTGSVLGGLATYIRKNKLVQDNLSNVRIEQGHFISRPGFVDLVIGGEDNEPPLVIAKARHFFSTQINLM